MIKEWFQKIISSKSKTFLAFCFSFIIGAGSSRPTKMCEKPKGQKNRQLAGFFVVDLIL
jgi:hypothetical protein